MSVNIYVNGGLVYNLVLDPDGATPNQVILIAVHDFAPPSTTYVRRRRDIDWWDYNQCCMGLQAQPAAIFLGEEDHGQDQGSR